MAARGADATRRAASPRKFFPPPCFALPVRSVGCRGVAPPAWAMPSSGRAFAGMLGRRGQIVMVSE
jgi:hypothetical protein